jgi:hypothetical protein
MVDRSIFLELARHKNIASGYLQQHHPHLQMQGTAIKQITTEKVYFLLVLLSLLPHPLAAKG